MEKYWKKVLLAVAGIALMSVTGIAAAGYYDVYGYYHVTCTPGYWAPGYWGPIWVPGVCG